MEEEKIMNRQSLVVLLGLISIIATGATLWWLTLPPTTPTTTTTTTPTTTTTTTPTTTTTTTPTTTTTTTPTTTTTTTPTTTTTTTPTTTTTTTPTTTTTTTPTTTTTTTTTATIELTASPAPIILYTGEKGTTEVTAVLKRGDGTPAVGVTVHFSSSETPGEFDSPTAVTDANGVATVRWTCGVEKTEVEKIEKWDPELKVHLPIVKFTASATVGGQLISATIQVEVSISCDACPHIA